MSGQNLKKFWVLRGLDPAHHRHLNTGENEQRETPEKKKGEKVSLAETKAQVHQKGLQSGATTPIRAEALAIKGKVGTSKSNV